MTEPASPFGSTAVAPPTQGDSGMPNFDDESGANRQKLILVGAVVGVLVLAVAAYFLLLKGGSSSNTASGLVPAASGVQSPAAPEASASGVAAGGTVTLPKIAKHGPGQNPFKPLVVAPVLASSNGSGSSKSSTTTTANAGTGTGTTTTAPVSPVTSPPVVVTSPVSSQPTTPPTKAPPAPVVATFLKFDRVAKNGDAVFSIFYSNGAGKNFTKTEMVKAPSNKVIANCDVSTSFCGTRFGKSFGLISITNGKFVAVQIGDAGYELKRGQKISATG